MMRSKVIGVLALQGGVEKHLRILKTIGCSTALVKRPSDLDCCDALILPGGESTSIQRQILFNQLEKPLEKFAKEKPLFGTCAGLILMSKETGERPLFSLQLFDITVERNGYGPQIASHKDTVVVTFPNKKKRFFEGVYIRAPRIKKWGKNVQVLGEKNGEPVLIAQGHHLGAAFHPELTDDTSIHEYFLNEHVYLN